MIAAIKNTLRSFWSKPSTPQFFPQPCSEIKACRHKTFGGCEKVMEDLKSANIQVDTWRTLYYDSQGEIKLLKEKIATHKKQCGYELVYKKPAKDKVKPKKKK